MLPHSNISHLLLRLLFVMAGVWGVMTLHAQDKIKYLLHGNVFDAQSSEPLPGAMVQLFDSAGVCVKASVTDTKGAFVVRKIHPSAYQVTISFLGYRSYSAKIDFKGDNKDIRLKDVFLHEEALQMNETKVTARGRGVVMRQDSLVYFAQYYKLPPGARMAELLRRMPGMYQYSEGDIRVNGRPVQRILVNGKEFFGEDISVALRYFPAHLIKELKVYDRKSDDARWTGVDDGNRETVIDLTVDDGMKNTWAGEVEAAYGSSKRYLGRASLNQFQENKNMSLLLQAGNDSKVGDDSNQSLGWNFNRSTKRLNVGGNVSLFRNVMKQNMSSSMHSFESVAAAFTESDNGMKHEQHNMNVSLQLEWQPDSMTMIVFSPMFNWSKGDGRQTSTSASFTHDPYAVSGVEHPLKELDGLLRPVVVNANYGAGDNKNGLWSTLLNLNATRRFKKQGRSLMFGLSGGSSLSENDLEEFRQISYYRLKNYQGNDSIYRMMQRENTGTTGRTLRGRLFYSEPLAAGWTLLLAYQASWRHYEENWQMATLFNFQPNNKSDSLRNRETHNDYWEQQAEVGFHLKRAKCQLNAGALFFVHGSRFEYQTYYKDSWFKNQTMHWAPKLNLFYRMSRQEQFNLSYHALPRAVEARQLMPDTLEMTDPLNLKLGNPDLKPSFSHRINMGYSRYDDKRARSYHVNMSYSVVQNSISAMNLYDAQSGSRTSIPVNVNGNMNGYLDFMMSAPLKNNKFTCFVQANANYARYVGFVADQSKVMSVKNATNQWVFRPTLRMNYRDDLFDISAYIGGSYDYSRNTLASAGGNWNTYSIESGASAMLQLPWGMDVSTDFSFMSRSGFSDKEMNAKEYIWNIQLAQSFLKDRKAHVALKMYDLLNGRNSVSRSFSSSMRSDVRYEAFGRYVMLHLSYNFSIMRKRK